VLFKPEEVVNARGILSLCNFLMKEIVLSKRGADFKSL